MTINSTLMKAILSMDAYNRGYNPGIRISENALGSAKIIQTTIDGIQTNLDSAIIRNPITKERLDDDISFYAIAYDYNGETVIAYRGTDSASDGLAYPIATGFTGVPQGSMAFQFYNAVASQLNSHISIDPRLANISVTGHSLGGGLAGLVGAVYGKDGALFDNMPFEQSAQNTRFSPIPDYLTTVYQGRAPWAETIVNNDPNGPIRTYSLDGEFLSWARPLQQTFEDPYQLPGPPNLSAYLPDSLDLHSISSLIIHMFSITEINGATDWEAASPYFWPLLYQNDFAQSIGEESASLLTTKLAYSTIDEGDTDARPFGDTGIRALYDDANDLGRALDTAGSGHVVETLAEALSQSFVQFAGELALNSVLKDTVPNALKGVLTFNEFDGSNALSVNLADDYWGINTGSPLHGADGARERLVNAVLDTVDGGVNTAQKALDIWGVGSAPHNAFDHITFGLKSGKQARAFDNQLDSPQAGLIIGGSGNDDLVGTKGNDLFIAGTGRNYIAGEGGIDIVSYAGASDAIRITGSTSYRNGRSYTKINKGEDQPDYLSGVDYVIGTAQGDYVDLRSGFTNQTIDGAGGENRFSINGGVYDMATDTYYDFDGNSFNKLINFEPDEYADTSGLQALLVSETGYTSIIEEPSDGSRPTQNITTSALDFSHFDKGITLELSASTYETWDGTVPHTSATPWGSWTGARNGKVYNDSMEFEFLRAGYIYGTNHDDTFIYGWDNTNGRATPGLGNDKVYIADSARKHVIIDYVGGHDEYYVGATLSRIQIDGSILWSDLQSISLVEHDVDEFKATLDFGQIGSLYIEFDDNKDGDHPHDPLSTFDIVFNNGGRINLKSFGMTETAPAEIHLCLIHHIQRGMMTTGLVGKITTNDIMVKAEKTSYQVKAERMLFTVVSTMISFMAVKGMTVFMADFRMMFCKGMKVMIRLMGVKVLTKQSIRGHQQITPSPISLITFR